jgi:hypothetical protein
MLRMAVAAVMSVGPALAADGAWVAFVRDGNSSVAFERSSLDRESVNLMSVAPKNIVSGIVTSWDIKTQVHQFDCAKRSYRLLTRKLFDTQGKQTGDETYIVTAMNDSFKDRMHSLNTEALRKAHALVCAKTEPSPAKPFASQAEALSWMAN